MKINDVQNGSLLSGLNFAKIGLLFFRPSQESTPDALNGTIATQKMTFFVHGK